MKILTLIEKTAYLFLIIVYAIGIYLAHYNLWYFDNIYSVEDGFVENGTAIMLFCTVILLIYKLLKFYNVKSIFWKIGILVFTTWFIFGAGEEISWGQRIFHYQPSEFFIEHNAQKEENLHNLIVDGIKVNKLIFSQLLTFLLAIYLFVIPVVYTKSDKIKSLVSKWGIAVSRWHHSLAFLLGTILLIFMPSSRKWEVNEFAFAIIFFLIFLNPLNKKELY